MRKNNYKNTRVNTEVQRELSLIIQGLKDPRIDPMTTVTEAHVTTDLKYCTAYVSVLGGEKWEADTMEGLKSATGYIRRELAARVNLRNTPELRFELDKSMQYGIQMSKLIDEVISQDEANHVETEEEAAARMEAEAAGETEEDADEVKDEQQSAEEN